MRVLLIFALAFGLLPIVAQDAVAADVPFMGVAELNSLLAKGPVHGRFETVAKGKILSTYDMEIQAVLDRSDLEIIIFTTDTYIASGMSGSPAYVKGLDGQEKLIGAVGYFMSPFARKIRWGGISPIERMQKESRTGQNTGLGSPVSFTYKGMSFMPIALGDQAVPEEVLTRNWVDAKQAELFRQSKFIIMTGPASFDSEAAGVRVKRPNLRAGMPIVVDLVEWQDKSGRSVTMSSMGTITYVGENGEVYGFGHPFLGARSVRYRFRTCDIVGVIESNQMSSKLPGKRSQVLGTIGYDGQYGIYGEGGNFVNTGTVNLTADFLQNGKAQETYSIRVAQSPHTSVLIDMALNMIGEAGDAPLPEQVSTALSSAKVELAGQKPIEYSRVFTSSQYNFGPQLVHVSSYDNAYTAFLHGIYGPLTASKFDFELTKISLSFDFSVGINPSLKVAAVKFPDKVKFGTDPVLELLLVSEDNQTTFSKRIPVQVDWSKVEEPAYTAETKDTDKQSEKFVGGSMAVYTTDMFARYLSDNEKATETPLHYLNASDYLTVFRKGLERSNRMLYARMIVSKRSGLKSEQGKDADLLSGVSGVEKDGWTVSDKGLTERKVTVKEETAVSFKVDLPPVPGGYVIAPVNERILFEVVQ